MEKSLLLIINPNSGKGNIDKKIDKIVRNFEKMGYMINKIYTKENDLILDSIKEELMKMELIVSCGGDGTLNEIVNAIVKLNLKVKLSFIPFGTMNDYAKTLEISRKKLESIESDDDIKIFSIDIGRFNKKYFNYVAACGAFTKVSYQTPQKLKKILGKFAYFISSIKYLFKLRVYDMRLSFEKTEIEGQFIYGSISNSKSIAGFKWFKKEKIYLDDGKFEVLFVRKPENVMQILKTLNCLIIKKYKEPYFVYKQVSNIKIRTKEEIEWTLDGENGGKTKEVEVQNIQKRIEYVIPSKR